MTKQGTAELATAQLARLREQMAALRPGAVLDAAEMAAPVMAKALGYAELVTAVLPQIRQLIGARTARAAASLPDAAGPVIAVVRRGPSWRMRGLAFGLPVVAGLGAYAVWRFRLGSRLRGRHVPPG